MKHVKSDLRALLCSIFILFPPGLALAEGADLPSPPIKIYTMLNVIQVDSINAQLPEFVESIDSTSHNQAKVQKKAVEMFIDPAANPNGLGIVLIDQNTLIRLGDITFQMKKGRLYERDANNNLKLDTDGPWKTIAADFCIYPPHKQIRFLMGVSKPFTIQRPDGTVYDHPTETLREGLTMGVIVDNGDEHAVSFDSINITRTYVQYRPLASPPPYESALRVLSTIENTFSIVLPTDKAALIKFPAAPHDIVLFGVLTAWIEKVKPVATSSPARSASERSREPGQFIQDALAWKQVVGLDGLLYPAQPGIEPDNKTPWQIIGNIFQNPWRKSLQCASHTIEEPKPG